MAERKLRIPRPRLPGRGGSDSKSSGAKAPKAKAAKASAKPKTAAGGSKAKAPAKKPPAPNMQERMKGLQGWMAEIERKQGRMTYFGGAAALIAIAVATAALVLAIMNQQDSVSKDDYDELSEQVSSIQTEVKESTEQQLKSLNETIGSFDQRIEAITQKQTQLQTTITDLQTQIDAQATGKKGAGATPPADPQVVQPPDN